MAGPERDAELQRNPGPRGETGSADGARTQSPAAARTGKIEARKIEANKIAAAESLAGKLEPGLAQASRAKQDGVEQDVPKQDVPKQDAAIQDAAGQGVQEPGEQELGGAERDGTGTTAVHMDAAPSGASRSGWSMTGGPRRWTLVLLAALALAAAAGVALGLLDPMLAGLMGALLVALLFTLWQGPAVASLPEASPSLVAPAPATRGDAQAAAVVAALPEPALLLSATGEIITANERVALAIGPTRVGDPLSFVVRVPEVLDAVRAAAGDGLPRRVEFAERIPLDRWLEAHVVPLRLEAHSGSHSGSRSGGRRAADAPDAVLLTFRDLTQQRRVEQMRADFVANASHELRTPLASLSGFIETLQGPARNDAPARERFLVIMAAQARRMSRLIDDLLSLSRIELNAHVRPQTKVDLAGILAHVCDTLSPLARDRGVTLEQVKDAAPLEVLGDRDELIRLFENLVENALKYGAPGKRIEVRLFRENGTAVVSIRDFGPGIPPEHLPRLTERFYRVDVAASRDQGGTGLGLAIVKHIVARHRGRLGIDSVLGQGATFSVRLDALPGPEKKSDQTAA